MEKQRSCYAFYLGKVNFEAYKLYNDNLKPTYSALNFVTKAEISKRVDNEGRISSGCKVKIYCEF
jgi:hypothetical protein